MGLLDLIAAYAAAQGAHTGGHFAEANSQGVPISLQGFQEVWNQPDLRKDTDINGAGFQMQDLISSGTNNREMSLANALIKGSYLAGIPGMLDKNLKGAGDINNMEMESGNKYTKELIAVSTLADLIKAYSPENKWSVGFSTFGTGQPGLKLNYRW